MSAAAERPRVLVVDDDPGILSQLQWALQDEFDVVTADNEAEARKVAADGAFDVITLDLALAEDDPETGFALLDRFLALDPRFKIVLVTGHDDRSFALRAVEHGAFDFFSKPIELDELRVLLRRAVTLRSLERENEELRTQIRDHGRLGDLMGKSDSIRDVFSLIRRVAPADVTVLVTGSSGTGKELVARELHRLSSRSEGAFVSISCGAIPENLLESELFGHEKGAYTGAHVARAGKLESAHGGTIFLDEIGEMPLSLQVKILRFLQEREIERIGARKVIPLDVRVIAATNRKLQEEVARGTFREDLYFRLSVVNVELPPLRERQADIAYLAQEFLHRYAAEFRRGKLTLGRDALRALQKYDWPGNVRELEHRVQRAVVLCTGRVIHPRDLELESEDGDKLIPIRAAREAAERRVVEVSLRRNCGNIARAAKDLEISRPTLHDLLRKFSITAADFKNGMGPDPLEDSE